ncbi:hypothetical protein L9F63_002898 [Diploptera punctata]|uniref:Uncharacterized protein n=1 Tax=Diploptera punctata TaxID=6984 RepID=A0AAD8ECJ5_DIPPU|nr:hypothetical protein L9F63_002898 [Diploptera punctata]
MEKIAMENELLIIDKEINSFKKQLELNKKRLSNKIKSTQLTSYKRLRLTRNRQHVICNKMCITQLPLPSRNILKAGNSFPNVKIEEQIYISKNFKNNTSPGIVKKNTLSNMNTNPKLRSVEMFPCKDIISNKVNKEERILDEKQEDKSELNEHMYNKQNLILVLNKWKKYALNKKILKAANKMEENRNKILMRKCWNTWIQNVNEKKRIVAAVQEKYETDQKIDRFLKILQEQKQGLVAPALVKDLKNINKANETKSNCFHQSKIVRFKKQTTELHGRFESKSAPSQLSIKYHNRFQTQQNKLQDQKSKLKEQSKLIQELKLQELEFKTENSSKQAYEEISRSLSIYDISLKPKLKQIQMRLSTANGRLETSERKYTVKSLRITPPLLQKMEERAHEREKRWQMIKERKLKRIEDKERQEKEQEEEKKKNERYEKIHKLEELKEKRRMEKELKLQRQKEKEKLIGLQIKAINFHKKKLMKNVFKVLHRLINLRREQITTSVNHHRLKLLIGYFYVWRRNIHKEYVVKYQVAADFYDFHLQEHVFITWHRAMCTTYMETIYKLGQASVHYNRTLLRRHIKLWEKLPFVMRLEREKEKRKQILRMKVQEMLPDYNPMYSIFGSDSFST